MSAINSSHSSTNNAAFLELSGAKKSSWSKFCGVDKLALIFASALIITGIVLFVLHALYAANFYIAAVATISTGAGIFPLALCTFCCVEGPCLKDDFGENTPSLNKSSYSHQPIVLPPEPLTTSTKEFFESKGIFGLTKNFIQQIDIWRRYRSGEELDLEFDGGMLLYGPTGNGKTILAKHIAEILGGEYVDHACGDIEQKYRGDSQKVLTALFTVPENGFRVIVMDEISTLLLARRGNTDEFLDCIIENFLKLMSEANNKKPRYLLIGTTNRIQAIDKAVLQPGRLGKHFFINNPDKAVSIQIFEHQLKQLKRSDEEDWTDFAEKLAEKYPEYSYAEISDVVRNAKQNAILAGRKDDVRKEDFLSDDLC